MTSVHGRSSTSARESSRQRTCPFHCPSRVRVSGSLRTQSWEDRDSGQRRYKTFVRADEVMFLDARQPGEAEAQPNEDEEEVPF